MIISVRNGDVRARCERGRTARRSEVDRDGQVFGRVIRYGLWAGTRSDPPTSLPLSPKPQDSFASIGSTFRATAMSFASSADGALPGGMPALVSAVDLAYVALRTKVEELPALQAAALP
jgi:hypothetical protein